MVDHITKSTAALYWCSSTTWVQLYPRREVIPSTFFLVGQGSGGDEKYHLPRTNYGLHHPSFALDEEVLPIGVELHTNLALRSIKTKLACENEESIVA
eukprot:scaffold125_cov210-Chaetoceros_neogracile.AAC.8